MSAATDVKTSLGDLLENAWSLNITESKNGIIAVADHVVYKTEDAKRAIDSLLSLSRRGGDWGVQCTIMVALNRIVDEVPQEITPDLVGSATSIAEHGHTQVRRVAGGLLDTVIRHAPEHAKKIISHIRQDLISDEIRNRLVGTWLAGCPQEFADNKGILQRMALMIVLNHQSGRGLELNEFMSLLNEGRTKPVSEKDALKALKQGVGRLNKTFGMHSRLDVDHGEKESHYGWKPWTWRGNKPKKYTYLILRA